MNFNLETIEKFLSNTFEIDCIDICLTQKIDNEPIVYAGPGTIYQDKHGQLQLKLYSKIVDIKKELSPHFKYHRPGKIIAEDNYFSLKAIEMSGTEWIADNVWVSAHVSFPTRSQVIKSNLKEIKTIEEGSTTDKNSFFIILPGNFKIPCNEKEDLPNDGWHFNRSVFTADNIEFEFKKLNNCLIINAVSAPDYLKEDTYVKLIEAISIVMGLIIRPVVVMNTQQGHSILKIKSVDNSYSNKEVPQPFKHSLPYDLQSFSYFIGKYLEAIDAPFSDLFGFWHKINRAWQADIENSSLSLSVSIEGLISSYFRELGLPDDEIAQQADKAKQKLNDIDLGERIRGRLLNSICGLLNNSSPKNALYRMVRNGLLSKNMVDVWEKLRNKSAHPDKLYKDHRALQKYIDQIYTCIALFYRLLFIIIKYEGSYIDYSEEGWPEKKMQEKDE